MIATLLVGALTIPARAQEKPAAPAATLNTVKVQLVVSRFQGEKKISSLPYTLTIHPEGRGANNPNGRANLRLGTQVPITTMSRNDANAPAVPTVSYKDVGTNIDCILTGLDEGRYKLDITVEDSSIDTAAGSGATNTHPAFRSFRTSDSIMLKDGQSAQYSTATDKVSGDVWKVDVTLNVVR
jgi:hypothetical protein